MKIVKTPRNAKGDLKLTPEEAQLIRDFRCISQRKQEVYADAISSCAEDERALRKSQKPSLRVIAGGAV